jgi:hypothetical protein
MLLLVLLCLLVRRRSWRSLPWFFAYVVFAICADLARFITQSHPYPYFWTYWTTEVGYVLLGFCVMYEVFRKIFGDLRRILWLRLIPGIIIIMALFATRHTEYLSRDLMTNKAIMLIVVGELSAKFVNVMMFTTTVTLVPITGLRWRQCAFGVAFGFGVFSVATLLATTHLSIWGMGYFLSWGWTLIISYSCAVLIWIWTWLASGRLGLENKVGEMTKAGA